jgi:glutamate dehydrogenase
MERAPATVDAARAAESRALLQYLYRNNFTFLGYRRYDFRKKGDGLVSTAVPGSALGVLRNDKGLVFGSGRHSPEVEALTSTKDPILVSKLIDRPATVHRRVPMDAISVKIYDGRGRLTGSHLFVGLFFLVELWIDVIAQTRPDLKGKCHETQTVKQGG